MARTSVDEMLLTIELEYRFTKGFTGRGSLPPKIMKAMRQVPRDAFVPVDMKSMAYANTPLPIGNGQTISQPFIVALMTDMLNPGKDDVILEVGSGCGYQAAILSLLAAKVYSIEIIAALAAQTAERLARLGYNNVEVRQSDGYLGWPENSPFDGIIVTAAAQHIPPPLKEQLAPGGRLVIPVGYQHMPQELLVLEKDKNGHFTTRDLLSVSFVPLTGEAQLHRTGRSD
ncbi:MAG: protein-L-isoaspartate(D-aspartate) O-methyltransferase [Proteobacteria bacterium]|nr:protein-L-isoaspartate(D-aspartate) O-methyltransferase [Pseudomonadota bacterium]MBU1137802.1 protein-L-isoaspartate(D-aspartate) O-methyltransferase [Pseudomonadota bacterium]MBU1232947.1 protein-L-isoaspartate(D-aspartate) O-methyltransferase [Pseudomonadota bacterium]MBU1418688.1 protein-L-isoaspartate(D-aspartate) O-methyltransferase [Pseudomonadota bacterium]MBU1454434.1 protein-L-isoaspartate(D-aspartate) O-methyltransferase [Pseudomonadota bacterium]